MQARATRLFALKLGFVMPFWYALGFLLLIVQTITMRLRPGVAFLVAECVIWAVVIVLTLMFLVPINNRIARADAAAFEALRRQHKRWDTLHRWRVAALSAAMVCLCIGIRL